jgi:hypothetical protein
MNQTTKTIIIAVIVAIVFFFAGNAYGKHSTANTMTAAAGQYGARAGAGFAGGMGGARGGGGIVSGTVVSKDATSITVQSGTTAGSKIVLVSPSTTVAKSAQGTLSDVAVGTTVTVIGTANPDGSVTATSVQIRPASAKATAGMPAGQNPMQAPMQPAPAQ